MTATPKASKPSATKIAEIRRKADLLLLQENVRGPVVKKLSGKPLEAARKGNFC